MKIVYTNDEGGVSVMQPVQKYMDDLPGTEEEKLSYIANKDLPQGTEYEIVENVAPFDATIQEIKQEAGRRINALFPDYKQRNYIARQSELDRIETGTMRDSSGNLVAARSLTSEEIAELVAIKGVWDWILSVRIASATIEASPPKIDQLETDSRWPANPS